MSGSSENSFKDRRGNEWGQRDNLNVIRGSLPDCIQKMEKQRCPKEKIQLEKL